MSENSAGQVRQVRAAHPRLRSDLAAPELDVPGLRHEALDHAVEHHPVIGALLRERRDALHVLRRHLLEEVHRDGAAGPRPRDLDLEARREAPAREGARGGGGAYASAATLRLIIRSGSAGRLAASDGVHVLHAPHHAAVDGVLAVEEVVVGEVDEELRVGRVGALRARGADRAAVVRQLRELRRQVGVLRAARPREPQVAALRAPVLHVAGLRHEALDHAVEHHPVIGALARQRLHALDVAGRHVGQELDRHRAVLELHENRVLRILDLGHAGPPRLGRPAPSPPRTPGKACAAALGRASRRGHAGGRHGIQDAG